MTGASSTAGRRPSLTVAISTHQRRDGVLETLDDVARRPASVPWEVLVVANACDDGTAAAVAERAAGFPAPLRVVEEPRAGLSNARNRGLAEAAAPLVVFVDDDVSPFEGWLDAYVAAFEGEDVVAAGGRIVPRLTDGVPRWVLEHRHVPVVQGLLGHYDHGDEACETGGPGRPHTPYGGNFAVRRDAACAVGGFRPDLGYGPAAVPGEETEFFTRLAPCGRILYVPGADVEHRIQPEKLTRERFVRYHRGQGRFDVRLLGPLPTGQRLRRIVKEGGRTARRLVPARVGGDPTRLARWARTSGRLAEHLAALRAGGTATEGER